MLIEFRVENFRSYREEQVLSLVASSDKSLPGNCMDWKKLRLLRSVALYGPNASGKSNLLKALSLMKTGVIESAKDVPGNSLPLAPFAFDENYRKAPSSFEVTFVHNDVRYQYGFSGTSERIHDEWLLAYPKGQPQLWFERKYDEKEGKSTWNFGQNLRGDKVRLSERTRPEALFLSVAAQWNHEQLSSVHEWFRENLVLIVSKQDFSYSTARVIHHLASSDEKAGMKFKRLILQFLRNADLGIRDIIISKSPVDEDNLGFPDDMPKEFRDFFIGSVLEPRSYSVKMAHSTAGADENSLLPLEEESEGTQRFFGMAGLFIPGVATGMTFLFDELEASLHPLLARELVKYVQSSETGNGGAQLVFATHDTTLLDPTLLRRDQVWLTERDEEGASMLYSLADYKKRRPRKGEAMQKLYLSGKYGAVPITQGFETP